MVCLRNECTTCLVSQCAGLSFLSTQRHGHLYWLRCCARRSRVCACWNLLAWWTLESEAFHALGNERIVAEIIGAVLAAALAIPNADPRGVFMVVMWTLWSVVLAAIAARLFAKRYDKSIQSNGI